MNSAFYTWYGYNEMLFHTINSVKDVRLDVFMQLGTVLGSHHHMPVYGGLLAIVALYRSIQYGREQRWSEVTLWLVAVLTFIGAYFVDGLFLAQVQQLLNSPRPSAALGVGAVKLLGHLEDYRHSFPSSHASFALTLIASLWFLLTWHQRIAGVLFVLWVGVSRVYVGAHFPADVVAGWLSAFVIVLVVRMIATPVIVRIVRWSAGRLALRARLR
jgi:membrane-associated phospholipid phosphatase